MQLKNYQQRSLDILSQYFRTYQQTGDANTAFYSTTLNAIGHGIPYNEVEELPGMPYVCLRVPTGGGKTLMACHAVHLALKEYLHVDNGLVLWLAPSKPIRDQTLAALKNINHPYHQALTSTLGSISVVDLEEARYLQSSILQNSTVILVSTTQAFRVEDPEIRKVYEPSGALMSHFDQVSASTDVDRYENGKPVPSLANLLRMHRPVVIVDEAHNVRSDISFMTLARFNPSCILEFTATPKTGKRQSNILYSISARELKAEGMIKLPLRLAIHPDPKILIGDAIRKLKSLERLSELERAKTREYIRPIMLLQAQPRRQNRQTLTVDWVEDVLIHDYLIPPEQIKRATGEDYQIGGIDLLAPGDVRYIITVQALREGWDCPFAYILCSVAEQHGATAVEQIVGRVLRMPKAVKKTLPDLNMAYAFVVSDRFGEALENLKDGLVDNGFERQEVEEMMAPSPPTDLGPLFAPEAAEGEIIVIHVDQAPRMSKIPVDIASGITYDTRTQTMVIPTGLSEESIHKIAESFSDVHVRETFIQNVQYKRSQIRRRNATQSERGEVFSVPVLAFRQGNLLEPFEETHFLDQGWSLDSSNAMLSAEEFSTDNAGPRQAELDITEEGRIRTEFLDNLLETVSLMKVDTGWKVSNLVYWLDRNIPHQDITAVDSGAYLNRLIMNLMEKREIPFEKLVREKYRLKDAVEKKINEQRKNAHQMAFSRLLQAPSPLEVSPDLVFTYDPEEYPAPVNSLYRGQHRFRKHYYPIIGDLKSSGEEHECAQFIDSLDKVEAWVRNIDSQPMFSFWLQTSQGRFYPDFVCKLKDDRYLIVEYKGGHLYTDAEEKRNIGELWEMRSLGKCLFVMPTDRKFEMIYGKVRG